MPRADRAALVLQNLPLARHFPRRRRLRSTKWRRWRWCVLRLNLRARWRIPGLLWLQRRLCQTWRVSSPRLAPQTTWNTSQEVERYPDSSCYAEYISHCIRPRRFRSCCQFNIFGDGAALEAEILLLDEPTDPEVYWRAKSHLPSHGFPDKRHIAWKHTYLRSAIWGLKTRKSTFSPNRFANPLFWIFIFTATFASLPWSGRDVISTNSRLAEQRKAGVRNLYLRWLRKLNALAKTLAN